MYTPLYIKTDNSLLTSMIKINDLIKKALELNLKALTITDNNMYGAYDFYKACINNDIKPIIGLEVVFNTNIVLYAKNYEGYQNLIKLSTIQSERMITAHDLVKLKDNLICIVPFESINYYQNLKKIYKDIFIGFKNIEERKLINGQAVYMDEILYLNKEDHKTYKYLVGIKEDRLVNQIDEYKCDKYLRSYDEVKEKFGFENNELITNMCNIEITKQDDLLPSYDCPNNLTSFEYLKELCKEGLRKKIGNQVPRVYAERLKYELNIINEMGFCDYFLVVWDYVKYAKEHDIFVGPGRGSAAGSLVSYCLDIITIDPIKYNLLFERFLNPERVTMPDIDIDFEDIKREEMIEYCRNKYGEKKVAPIIAFGTLKSKQAIRDVSKTMDIEPATVDNLCKMIDANKTLTENLEGNTKLQNLFEINDELKRMYNIAMKFEGNKRQTTVHAAGIIMSKKDIDEIIPLDRHGSFYTTGFAMDHLEELGLLKMDFLAIRTLTVIHNIIRDVNEIDPNLTFDNIPLNDPKALNVFTTANTMGIFQFESTGMMNFIRKFKPTTFEDIFAALALFRPGPMKNIDSYIDRKHGKERIDYIDPSLESILKPTYGFIVYQEQIMQIASTMASYTLGEADVLRRAMSKKKESILIKEKEKFISRSVENNYREDIAEKVYNLILKFAEYGFNRSHSVAYAMISYKMAYLKAHYPKIFFKNQLTIFMSSDSKTKEYMYDCNVNNIAILKPNINYSYEDYNVEEKGLRYPLTAIKNVGKEAVRQIVEERNKHEFTSIYDFMARAYGKAVNRKVMDSLIDSGCFDDFGFNRNTLKTNIDTLINYSDIAGVLDESDALSLIPEMTIVDEYPNKELTSKELELFGIYLGNNPITEIKKKENIKLNISELKNYLGTNVKIIVSVDRLKEIETKKSEKMLFITASDELSMIDAVLFPSTYAKFHNIEVGNAILLDAKVEMRSDKVQLVVNQVRILG